MNQNHKNKTLIKITFRNLKKRNLKDCRDIQVQRDIKRFRRHKIQFISYMNF